MIFPFPGMKQWTSIGATVFVTECNESSSSHDYVLTGTALEQVQEHIAQDNLGAVANCGDLTTTQTVAAPAFSPGQAETQPIAPPVRIWKDIRKWPLHPNSPSAFEREQELVDSLIKLHVARNTQVSYVRPQP
ncbi:hypothetical protein WOLCODRAFT_136505 [Wolfiporia cocos MD-104 SS10]|uniref:Uncharacterized protein n=1 Tax=Wolfiporia cocos (strain MD-104) TaxID=742152 RepID=A0A2H3JE37_WOLCO|nr:hypothetical protein WOLCODRAFT_136505 [Wolfiporia cocos MD-104 SS10]